MTIVEMRVHMDCPGCESKIKKSLQKLDGVDNVDIDMIMQKVTVTGWVDQKKVLKTVRKSGRHAELWPFPYNPEYHAFNQTYYNQYYTTPATYYEAELPNCDTLESPASYSSYNYYKHGYSGHDRGYFMNPPFSTVIDNETGDMFSDENAHGCSIM